MYITVKMKLELSTAGVDVLDKAAVRAFYDKKYEDRIRAEEEEQQRISDIIEKLKKHLEPHPPTAEDTRLFELIKKVTKNKFYTWLYIEALSIPNEEYFPEWQELLTVNWLPRAKFDLFRLKACGLLIMVEGHYKTQEELDKMEIFNHPIEHFESRDKAIEFALSRIVNETIRLKSGKVVFKLKDLLLDLIGHKQSE